MSGLKHQYGALVDRAPVYIHEIDKNGRLLSTNQARPDLVGAAQGDEIVGLPFLDILAPEKRPEAALRLEQAFAGNAVELQFSVSGHPCTRYFASCLTPCTDAQGRVVKLIALSVDISRYKAAEIELRRMARAQGALASCNHSLARAKDEPELLQAFCDNLVGPGGYACAMIGYVSNAERFHVRMVAHASWRHADFPAALLAVANEANARQVVIQKGEPVVLRAFAEEPELASLCDAVQGFGYKSMIVLPLRAESQLIGNLSIFSAYPDGFDGEEIALLTELGANLSFGIQTARKRTSDTQSIRRLRDAAEKEERERIAAYLHDLVGQAMQSVNLGLKRLRALEAKDGQLSRELLDDLISDVGTAIGDLRDIGKELRPLFLERMDLSDAVHFHCCATSKRTGVAIRFLANCTGVLLQEHVKEQCFLSFREALANALRHARANQIDVSFHPPSSTELTLTITDDGVGFDTQEIHQRPSGLGLAMIRERIASVGGSATIRSQRGKGTEVEVRVPLTNGAGA